MKAKIILTGFCLVLFLLTGCTSPVFKRNNLVSFETSYSSNFKTATPVRGYKKGTLNLVKYTSRKTNSTNYKLQVMSQAGDSPSFKKGESLTIVLDQRERVHFTSLDGEVTVRYHKTRPIRAIYYPVTDKEVNKIASSKHVEFYSYGYNYDVAGKLTPSEINVFKKMYDKA